MTRIATLRRYAIARSLFAPTTLRRAVARLGFVQADPIRAPARAQDLILRHRVRGYRAADLERCYPGLAIEEDFFVNYGFLPRHDHACLHPRPARIRRGSREQRRMAELLEYAGAHGAVHPRAVAGHFAHGRVQNYFGGASHATTQLLDRMHYLGLLRVARRDGGVRVYAPRAVAAGADPWPDAAQRAARLLELVVNLYAPLPASTLTQLVAMLRRSAPQLGPALTRAAARARAALAQAVIDGVTWYWPVQDDPRRAAAPEGVRLLAPFDPVVWDRRRFEHFWGWAYRFEAYTPAARRRLGYYALPLLWRDQVVGWGNLSVEEDVLVARLGYVAGAAPRGRPFRGALEDELADFAAFLRLPRYRID